MDAPSEQVLDHQALEVSPDLGQEGPDTDVESLRSLLEDLGGLARRLDEQRARHAVNGGNGTNGTPTAPMTTDDLCDLLEELSLLAQQIRTHREAEPPPTSPRRIPRSWSRTPSP